jgi:hypothetical protein
MGNHLDRQLDVIEPFLLEQIEDDARHFSSNASKLGASAFTPSRSLDSTNQTAASAS